MYQPDQARRRRIDAFRVVTNAPDKAPPQPCARARWLLRQPDGFVVWDTETTGLDDDSAIVSIGAVDQDGAVLLDMLINPGRAIPRNATDIHGVTDDMVADAPTFEQAYPAIRQALHRRRWVIYNSEYDTARLRYECERAYLPRLDSLIVDETKQWYKYNWRTEPSYENYCVMLEFAQHYGDFNDYFESYTWQSLDTAARYYRIRRDGHHALGDAQTTLEVLRRMALDEDTQTNEES